MNWTRSILSPAMVLVSLPVLAAQEPEGTPDQTLPQQRLMTFSFPGGDVGEFLTMLRKQSGTRNVLLSPGSEDVAVPPMSVENVTLPSALAVMEALVESRSVRVYIQDVKDPTSTAVVYVVRVEMQGRNAGTPEAASAAGDSLVRVFSLRGLTDADGEPAGDGLTIPAETVLTAIDTGLGLADTAGTKPVVRYHRDSGLLFVQGSPAEIDVVQQVLRELQSSLERSRLAARQSERSRGTEDGGGEPARADAPTERKAR